MNVNEMNNTQPEHARVEPPEESEDFNVVAVHSKKRRAVSNVIASDEDNEDNEVVRADIALSDDDEASRETTDDKKHKKHKRHKEKSQRKKHKKHKKHKKAKLPVVSSSMSSEDESNILSKDDNVSLGDDDDDELSSDGADMVDDDDKPVYADGADKSGDSEPSAGDSIGSDEETGMRRLQTKAAANKRKKNATEDVPVPAVDWPSNDDVDATTFDAYVVPLRHNVHSKEALCIALFTLVDADVEAMRSSVYFELPASSAVVEGVAEPDAAPFNEAWRTHIAPDVPRAHSCNAVHGAVWQALIDDAGLGAECSYEQLDEALSRARREPACRDMSTRTAGVRRAWLYVVLSGDEVAHVRCTVGAYRVRMRCVDSCVPGIGAADFAKAAVSARSESLDDAAALSAFAAKELAARSLCLVEPLERTLYEFDERAMSTFVRRKTSADNASSVNVSCFAGFPIDACSAGRFKMLGVTLGVDSYCEPLPSTFSSTLKLTVDTTTATSTKKAHNTRIMSSVVYNVEYAVRIMLPHCFDAWFMRTASESPCNVTFARTAENQRAVCVAEWLKQRTDVRELSAVANSGHDYAVRVRTAVREAFKAASGGEAGVSLSHALVRNATRRLCEMSELVDTDQSTHVTAAMRSDHAKRTLPADVYNLATLRRFLAWFGDAFMAPDRLYTLGVRCMGLTAVNKLREHEPHSFDIALNTYIRDEHTPYAVLFDESLRSVRHLVRDTLDATFVPWLCVERADAYAVLGSKLADVAPDDEQRRALLVELFTNVMFAVGSLASARHAGERCVPVYQQKAASGERRQSLLSSTHYVRVVNVPLSPVRIVPSDDGARCVLVDALDYECERALRTVLLNEAHVMQLHGGTWRTDEDNDCSATALSASGIDALDAPPPLPPLDTDARLVLVRADDADVLMRLLDDELNADIEYAVRCSRRFKRGSASRPPLLLAVAHDEVQLRSLRTVLSTLYASDADGADACYVAYTLQDVLNIGPSRVSLTLPHVGGATRWGSLATQCLVYNAHRFAYDELCVLFACLTGVANYGPPAREGALRRMSDNEMHAWERAFEARNHMQPLESDFTAHERRRLLKYTRQMSELADEFGARHTNASEQAAHWRNGQRTRWILSGIAYQRPHQSLLYAPPGNAFEDLYFSNVGNGSIVRVREQYVGLARQLQQALDSGRLVCIADSALSTHLTRRDAIDTANNACLKRFCAVFEQRKREEERREAQRRAKLVSNAKRSAQFKIEAFAEFKEPVDVSVSRHSVRVSYAPWLHIERIPFVPSWVRNSTYIERFTNVRRTAVDMTSGEALLDQRHFNCDMVLLGSERATDGSLGEGTWFDVAPTSAVAASLEHSPDITGCGRWFFSELMARLRTKVTEFVLVGDTLRNLCRTSLVPHTRRKTCVNWLCRSPNLRVDGSATHDADFMASHTHFFSLDELNAHRHAQYASCLQSASVLLWRRDYEELVRLMKEEETMDEQQ